MELYRENREEPDDNSSYSYPTTLLRFIDRKEMFNRYYNWNLRRRHTDPVVSKHDCTRRFTVEPSMREELCRIFRREKDLLENTKISRLDYLKIAPVPAAARRSPRWLQVSQAHAVPLGHVALQDI